ncbi:MAG: hypothetical protein EAX87_02775, partial [Candidatus Thorarchaeota archaeon]|nr:hypothetical protein [Candidatus Thorarchaeota archaeon]
MIDDDFESVFRKMIEHFMETFGEMPEGNMNVRVWNGSIVNEPIDAQIEHNDDTPLVEKIDLEEGALILIEWRDDIDSPSVRISGSMVFAQGAPEKKEIRVDVGFLIDIDRSKVSHRNG